MVTTPIQLTFEQYLTYSDGTDNRYELEDGILIEMPTASKRHSDIIEFLYDILKAEIKRLSLDYRVKSGDVGVRTGVRKSRIPDLCVIEGEIWRALPDDVSAVIQSLVPLLLAVEVVSPGEENWERDYTKKKSEYEQSQIPEYWIIDPINNKITIFSLKEGQYKAIEYTPNQVIKSQIFTELILTTNQILLSN